MSRVCVACRGQRLEQISEELRFDYAHGAEPSTWRYRWLRCSTCELTLLDPEPSLELIQRFAGRSARELGSPFSVISWCLAAQLPKDAVILDLACGDGRWLSRLAACGFRRLHGHACAAEPERVSALRARGIVVTEGNFLAQELPSASYDCIRIHDALAMGPEPAATVRQCLRILKPSGVLLLHAPASSAAWSCLDHARVARRDVAPCHVYHHTAEALRALLLAAGFRDLRMLSRARSHSLSTIIQAVRQQAGKFALPGALSLLLRPAFLLASLWGERRDWLMVAAREPAAVRLRPSTNGHSRGLRHALFTRF